MGLTRTILEKYPGGNETNCLLNIHIFLWPLMECMLVQISFQCQWHMVEDLILKLERYMSQILIFLLPLFLFLHSFLSCFCYSSPKSSIRAKSTLKMFRREEIRIVWKAKAIKNFKPARRTYKRIIRKQKNLIYLLTIWTLFIHGNFLSNSRKLHFISES